MSVSVLDVIDGLRAMRLRFGYVDFIGDFDKNWVSGWLRIEDWIKKIEGGRGEEEEKLVDMDRM